MPEPNDDDEDEADEEDDDFSERRRKLIWMRLYENRSRVELSCVELSLVKLN